MLVALWIGTAAKNVDDWGTSDPNFAKARTAVEEGRFQLALQYLKRAESLDPDNATSTTLSDLVTVISVTWTWRSFTTARLWSLTPSTLVRTSI